MWQYNNGKNLNSVITCDVEPSGSLDKCEQPSWGNVGIGQVLSQIVLNQTNGLIYYVLSDLEASTITNVNNKDPGLTSFKNATILNLALSNSKSVAYVTDVNGLNYC